MEPAQAVTADWVRAQLAAGQPEVWLARSLPKPVEAEGGRRRWYRSPQPAERVLYCLTRAADGYFEGFANTGCSLLRPDRSWDAPYNVDELSMTGHWKAEVFHDLKGMTLPDEDEITQHMRRVVRCRRVRSDANVHFGDGGAATMVFPMFVRSNLLPEPERLALLQALDKLGAERKDFQSSVVEDLIDPNLFPHRLSEDHKTDLTERYEQRKREWERRHRGTVFRPFDEDLQEWEREDEDAVRDAFSACDDAGGVQEAFAQMRYPNVFPHHELPPSHVIRHSYSWIPSRVHINSAGQAKFVDHINMLERTKATEQLYVGLERALSAMVPELHALHVLNPEQDEWTINVICKAQRYVLEPLQTYKGFWHREGLTERIAAVGVYYVDVPPGLVGGAVKFRTAGEPPDESYGEYCEVKPECSVATLQNSALVFSNVIPHRVRLMQNQSQQRVTRTFINFFVIDPAMQLAVRQHHFTGVQLADRLSAFVREQLGREVPKDVLRIIFKYAGVWADLAEAQAFRNQYRKALMSTKNEGAGWAYMHYGNCGVQKFAPCLQELDLRWRDEVSALHHTSSASASDTRPEEEEEEEAADEADMEQLYAPRAGAVTGPAAKGPGLAGWAVLAGVRVYAVVEDDRLAWYTSEALGAAKGSVKKTGIIDVGAADAGGVKVETVSKTLLFVPEGAGAQAKWLAQLKKLIA